jgi:hypothetical protein
MAGRIGDVGRGIEGTGEIGESMAVVAEVDLHAADINVAHALGLQFARLGQGFIPVGEEPVLRAGLNGPGPGKTCPVLAPPATRFSNGDGGQQLPRNGEAFLRRTDGAGA